MGHGIDRVGHRRLRQRLPSDQQPGHSAAFIPAAELEQTVSLSVTFSFNASQADVAIVHVRSSLLTADQPIDNPTGATTGRGEQVFAVTIPAAAGAYPLEVWMTDGAGHDSNKLYGAVTVAGGGSGT